MDQLDILDASQENFPGITWLELSPGEDRPISAAAKNAVAELRKTGIEVTVDRVICEPFWSLQELVEVPALIEQTCHYFPVVR